MKSTVETLTGAIVITIAITFLLFAYRSSGGNLTLKTYQLMAKFDSIDGINNGSEIKLGGVKIGHVKASNLDKKSYAVQLELAIDEEIKLPSDSSIQVVSEGLLGGKYLAVTPGAEDKMLEAGNEIHYTYSSVNIETLIGKMIFSNSDKK